MLDTFHRISLPCKRISLFLFHIWSKSQAGVYNGSPLIPQAEFRGGKVLPPHGAWVIEANCNGKKNRAITRDHFTELLYLYLLLLLLCRCVKGTTSKVMISTRV